MQCLKIGRGHVSTFRVRQLYARASIGVNENPYRSWRTMPQYPSQATMSSTGKHYIGAMFVFERQPNTC